MSKKSGWTIQRHCAVHRVLTTVLHHHQQAQERLLLVALETERLRP
jgi:hypothetical protein